jgi:hypothetical protein
MSHKGRKQQKMQNQPVQMPNIQGNTKKTVDTVLETLNNNKLLIGSIAAGCGAAIYILATESGGRLRNQIQDRTVDLYHFVSEQVKNGISQSRDLINEVLSGAQEEAKEVSGRVERAA